MLKIRLWALALAGALIIVPKFACAQYADSVVSYASGTGFAAGFTDPTTALGAPASGSGITPFAPPFSKSQLVSVGAGGEITLQFNTPIQNNAGNPFGVDFMVFANEFFVSSGGNVNGVFTHAATTLIQVSADGSTWFTLNPLLAPAPGNLFPTDGTGNPHEPVNPALSLTSFTGANLAGVRSLYAGSAGGAGYDLSWAEDAGGNSVNLPDADFVRIKVENGVLDLDAISEAAPVPESGSTLGLLAAVCAGLVWRVRCRPKNGTRCIAMPAFIVVFGLVASINLQAETISESFTNDPASDGWQIFGDSSLFAWDSTNHDLAVTWDSARSNSYFYHTLGTTVTRHDDFCVEFDLLLTDDASGTEPGKTGGLEMGIGFLNFADATSTNFMRGAFGGAPSLAEFDYFPAGYFDFGGMIFDSAATTTPTFISINSSNYAPTIFAPYEFELPTNLPVHVAMNYTASSQTLVTRLTTNGILFIQLPEVVLTDTNISAFTDSDDVRLDTFAVSSYSSAGDDFDSVLAHGTVNNISVSFPRPIRNFSGNPVGGIWAGQFASRSNWMYTLQRSCDFQTWTNISPAIPGNATNLPVQDPNPPQSKAFYRVQAILP